MSARVNKPVEPPEPPARDDVSEVCERFASAVCAKLDAERPIVAVLPIADASGTVTPFSDYLADKLLEAFLSTSARVVDRGNLQAVLTEIDLGSVFDQPQQALRVARADVLVVGRYSLTAGRLALDLKAIDVNSGSLIFLASEQVPATRRVRQLAFSSIEDVRAGRGVEIRETEGGVRVRASYTEQGAGSLRLLDRVRQRIRRLHARYLRDAVGLDLTSEETDDRFRRGRETDCQFGQGSVTLEMEFGVSP